MFTLILLNRRFINTFSPHWKIFVSQAREYLAVMTRPNLLTTTIPIESLIEDVQIFSSAFKIAEETSQTTEALLALLGKFPTGGKQIHDANVVASMLSVGVRSLLTNNAADFARFSTDTNSLKQTV